MADSDKNILITPNTGQAGLPKIEFIGSASNPITLNVEDDNSVTFSGSEGQLFSISDNLSSGTIFSVNDISGIPSIEVDADGTVLIAEFDGNVGIGMSTPPHKLSVSGTLSITGSSIFQDISGTVATFSQITGSFSGSGTNITNLTASNITNFTGDVRGQFSAGTGISLTSGEIATFNIPNASLENSSVTVGTTSISLGSSATTIQGISILTGSTITGSTAEFTNITASLVSSSNSYISSLVAGGVQYPTADGESGQILVSNGAGVLNFEFPDVLIKVKNLEATQIDKGTPLYITASGTPGNVAGVYRADAGNTSRMPAGCIAFEDIASDTEGTATLVGFIAGVDTSLFASGEAVYVSVGGGYTNVRPTGSALVQPLGYVEKVDSTNGSGIVQGPGHYWGLPNISSSHIWIGGSNGVPVAADFSSSVNSVISASNKVSSDTSLVSGSDQITNMVSLTQAEYDALTPVSGTFYIIVG